MLIETNRFLLREFTTEDTPAFVAYHRDPRYTALYGPEEAEPNHLNHLVETFMAWAEEQPRLNYQLALCRKAGLMPLIGCAGLRRAGCREGEAELGIELAPDVWGRYRYAVEITQALLDLGFSHLGLKRVFGFTLSANEAVRRLAEWFGASVVGTRPGPEWMQERGWMQVEWEVTPARWREAARGSGAAFKLKGGSAPRRTGCETL